MTVTNATTTQVLYPALRYTDAHAAIEWLCKAFGFEKHVIYEGPEGSVAHAELALNGALIMLGSFRKNGQSPVKTPKELGGISASIYVYVPDVDAHCARARSAGAHILLEPYDTEYGTREYAAKDLDGYGWSFGTYHP